MFTGIIETTGSITEVFSGGSNKTFWVSSSLSRELKPDQSLSHNGVCLTVEEVKDGLHRVTAIEETLIKTNLGNWQPGTFINLERCMPLNSRLDGHIVQGHVDTVATCTGVTEKNGSWEYDFLFPIEFNALVIEKGAVSLNGISLTLFNVGTNTFTVAIVPYTYGHTNIKAVQKGDAVNVEFDVIGKYVNRIIELRAS